MFSGGRLPVGRTINDSSPNASAAGCPDKHAGQSQADWLSVGGRNPTWLGMAKGTFLKESWMPSEMIQ